MKDIAVRLDNVPKALQALDRLEREIKKAPKFDNLNLLIDLAVFMQRRWRPVVDVANRAGRCWIRGEFRIGQERKKVGPAKGARGHAGPGRGKRRTKVRRRFDGAPTLAELKLSKRQAARGEKLRSLGWVKVEKFMRQLVNEGRPVAPNALLALTRLHNKLEKKYQITQASFSDVGPFDCVVIDPPWMIQKVDRDERPNQDAFDYPRMTESQIEKFWYDEISGKLNPDCHVFCWTTQKYLPATFKLLNAWDLKYVFTMVWHKPGGFQPVDLPQYNCEFVVYARQGAPIFIDTSNFFCCFEAPRREHSRKPDEFYDLIRRVTGGSRIDVFSREKRPGFAQYGNEIDKFREAAE
jgi:N6-adenosine-specific RNA methylase IME4